MAADTSHLTSQIANLKANNAHLVSILDSLGFDTANEDHWKLIPQVKELLSGRPAAPVYTFPKPKAVDGSRFARASTKAARRGKVWRLSRREYDELAGQPCFYCGSDTGDGIGLDRQDNKIGYQVDNVIPCCGRCNGIKGPNLSRDEALVVIAALA